ncbi:MAG: nucleoside triphosphate pyrophosphatase [Dehalococcoidia bacterium]|jgi:MAF protein|nr:nucleoside triphosphate pyrophosphatase [Dehalococcoidia bacterium]
MIERPTPSNRPPQDVKTGNMPHLVLASGSPRRAEILASVGLKADVRPTDIPEHRTPGDGTPESWALRLASEKAAAASRLLPDAITLGADTVVVINGEVLGKPSGPEDALVTLGRLRNRTHRVVTAVALAGPFGKSSGWSSTDVRIRDLDDREIVDYVHSGLPLDKAGSYGIQDQPFDPAERIKGCYLNVVGLPLCLTTELFELAGTSLNVKCNDCSEPMNTVSVRS